jgi:hypothetical protein
MHKAITFIGMSGVGKTHMSRLLEQWGWTNYSCDYLIGSEYLKDELDGTVTPDDLRVLSAFVGRIGRGAQSIKEFRRRQQQYIDAEKRVMRDAGKAIKEAPGNFVNDSAGSLCEIEDEDLFEELGKETLFVYIEAGPDEEKELLRRAAAYPKPLYFPPAKFDAWLKEYMEKNNQKAVEEIEPDDFLKWVFPLLYHSRVPKYQRLAKKYGVTIPAAKFQNIKSEEEFLSILEKAKNNTTKAPRREEK